MDKKSTPEYLNEKEVAKLTRRSLSTLRNDRCQCKGLPYLKVGRSILYSLDDVIHFLESKKIIPTD